MAGSHIDATFAKRFGFSQFKMPATDVCSRSSAKFFRLYREAAHLEWMPNGLSSR
jgi:hypothetical protein